MNSAETERAAIVAWLRGQFHDARYGGIAGYDPHADMYDVIADAIERGAHIKDTVLSENE